MEQVPKQGQAPAQGPKVTEEHQAKQTATPGMPNVPLTKVEQKHETAQSGVKGDGTPAKGGHADIGSQRKASVKL